MGTAKGLAHELFPGISPNSHGNEPSDPLWQSSMDGWGWRVLFLVLIIMEKQFAN